MDDTKRRSAELRVAVLFHRLGPYHFARLREAGTRLVVTAVESSRQDETYDWDLIPGAEGFDRVTLFEAGDARSHPRRDLIGRMQAALSASRPEVVVIPGWSDRSALAALRWSVASHVAVVLMSESTVWDDVRKPWREWIKRRVIRLCSAALAGGSAHKDYLVQLGMKADRVFRGYDAVDNDYFSAHADQARAREAEHRSEYQLPARYFLASSRFIYKKNLQSLIRAFAAYRRNDAAPEMWDLVLLGDGELRPEIEGLILELGLRSSVHLPGFRQYSELPVYYGLAGAFVHASTVEQWGLVVNEAMASGLPVLVSNRCGCAPDLLVEGRNGFTFDPFNVDSLADLMGKISRMPDVQLRKMGEESRAIIAGWGPAAFASGLCQAVERAVGEVIPRASLADRFLLRLLNRL